jgi:hypothetical protein
MGKRLHRWRFKRNNMLSTRYKRAQDDKKQKPTLQRGLFKAS